VPKLDKRKDSVAKKGTKIKHSKQQSSNKVATKQSKEACIRRMSSRPAQAHLPY
jgi:hypothetical protein